MNRKGFTLVELLAVIVLMAILITVAVPSITKIGKSLKTESFCSKVKVIEAAALEYADDYFIGKENAGSNMVSLDNVSLMDLVNMGYLKSDVSIGTDSNGHNTTCQLYDANSICIMDPRDSSSMDYETVRIWSSNNKLYATYRYKDTDIDGNSNTSGVCGNNMQYARKISDTGTNQSTFSNDMSFFNRNVEAIKVKENNVYSWSNYYSYRTTRPDDIPGNYYVKEVTVSYGLSNNKTAMELSSDDFFSGVFTNGTQRVIDVSNYYLSNVDISFRVALNSPTRVTNTYAKVSKIQVKWQKVS